MFQIVLIGILSIGAIYSHESGSAEVNKIEMTPFYDTIIFSDVADIFNDFENGMNPLEALFNSASDSEENLDDLLAEYQHYLDRAHKQRITYLEKSKTKNKIPLTRQDRFAKTKPAGGMKGDDFFYPGSYINPNKPFPTQYGSPLDVFVPVNQKLRYMGKTEFTPPVLNEEYPTFEKRLLDLPPNMPKSSYDPIKPSCFCKSSQLPCECKCKQCFVPYDSVSQNKGFLPNADFISEDKLNEDNTLNIRIKVDIQLPKTKDIFTKFLKNHSHEELSSKETTVNLPFPYFNFPIPMDLIGYKKPPKAISHDTAHKITIHKKKKSRLSNGNKKHRKKVITFHNLNIQPPQSTIQPYLVETLNTSIDFTEKATENSNLTATTNNRNISTTIRTFYLETPNTTLVNNSKDNITTNIETQTEESIYVMVNISNGSDNGTEDVHKIENSVETDYTKPDTNVPTEKLSILRKRRDISSSNSSTLFSTPPLQVNNKSNELVKNNNTASHKMTLLQKNNDDSKKADKVLLADAELVYWPNIINKNLKGLTSKNITTMILEREDKKTKLNMTKEAIRNNRTTALEKAIFGDVNWDDVDTVAPVFLSFVGKYLQGVLTFCSENVCHSMKCAQKTCVHRECQPSDRWNQRGHCAGSNRTDSVASLESIMDLPSNIAFEIVDILQDKMLGKLFGKVTLCINSKCITFVAAKKSFLKSKCNVKDLKMGHCSNIKNFKIM